jgi:biopolymer transport protein ExbD
MSIARSRGHNPNRAPHVEINVVPLVDVALVLLIIFMVTATFVKSRALDVDLPSASAKALPQTDPREIVLEVDKTGGAAVNGTHMSDIAIGQWLGNEAAAHGIHTRVVVYGDGRAPYERVIRVLSLAQAAGFTKVMEATRSETAH